MQQHRAVQPLTKIRGLGYMIVVAVSADDRGHVAAGDGVDDRLRLVCGVDDLDVAVVTVQSDGVVDFPGAAVERESSLGDDALDAQRCTHRTTTDRSTSPACMVWKASSTSSILIRSVTNFSSGSLP